MQFAWLSLLALADVDADAAWVIAPVDEPYPIREDVTVAPLEHVCALAAGERT